MDIKIDSCLFYKIGNPVLIVAQGHFPRIPTHVAEREKTGLMFEFKDEKIIAISFCYIFLKTDNCFIFEKKRKMALEFKDKSSCNIVIASEWANQEWENKINGI